MRKTIIRVLNEKVFAKIPHTLNEFVGVEPAECIVEGANLEFIEGIDGEMEIKVSLIDDDVRCEELIDILSELDDEAFSELVSSLEGDEQVKFLNAIVLLVNSLRTYRAGALKVLTMATNYMVAPA